MFSHHCDSDTGCRGGEVPAIPTFPISMLHICLKRLPLHRAMSYPDNFLAMVWSGWLVTWCSEGRHKLIPSSLRLGKSSFRSNLGDQSSLTSQKFQCGKKNMKTGSRQILRLFANLQDCYCCSTSRRLLSSFPVRSVSKRH